MYEKEVAAGSAWMDENFPEWYKKIDIKRLDLRDYGSCAIGQTFGELISKHLCADTAFSAPRGFVIRGVLGLGGSADRYHALSGAWVREILRRRNMDRLAMEISKKLSPRPVPIPSSGQEK